MKYDVIVAQYFDTYLEWKKSFGKTDTLEEARKLESEAHKRYHDRPLVSYSIYIAEN